MVLPGDTINSVDILRDPRFELEDDWHVNVLPHINYEVVAIEVFCQKTGVIYGWKLINQLEFFKENFYL